MYLNNNEDNKNTSIEYKKCFISFNKKEKQHKNDNDDYVKLLCNAEDKYLQCYNGTDIFFTFQKCTKTFENI